MENTKKPNLIEYSYYLFYFIILLAITNAFSNQNWPAILTTIKSALTNKSPWVPFPSTDLADHDFTRTFLIQISLQIVI
jgi:hypothetical protein